MGVIGRMSADVVTSIVFILVSSRAKAVVINNMTEGMDFLSSASDPRVRPLEGTGQPDSVNVSMYIGAIHAIDDVNMEFAATMYFRNFWNDPRLQYESANANIDMIILSGDQVHKMIWIPDLFFSNARIVEVSSSTKAHAGVRVKPNGDVMMSTMLTITAKCPMHHALFPFDKQMCELRLESYFYTSTGISLGWRGDVGVMPDTLATHAFIDVTTDKRVQKFSIGSFENLVVRLEFHRRYGHYILMIYLPSFLLVLLSCLLFWMPIQSLAERTFFGAFLFLAMIFVHSGSQIGTPQTSYIRALDVWTVSCLFFLAVAVTEVFILHLVAKGSGFASRNDHVELVNEEGGTSQTSVKLGPFTIPYVAIKRADLVLSLVYPAAWILFNIVYWSIY